MDIHMAPATAADIPGLAACACRAFAHDEFEHALFPQADAPPGHNPNSEFRVNAMTARLASPSWRSVVATIQSPGAAPRLAGYATWKTPQTSPEPPLTAEALAELIPKGMNMEVAEYANDVVEKAKKETLGPQENDVWYLASLAVDPDFQGKGIASKLVQWGLDQADRDGKAAYLESSPAAVGVYRRLGFQALGTRPLIKDYDGHLVTLMKREPVSA